MTKKKAIQQVRNAFDAWEGEFKTLNDDWSYEHKARDMAIEALKRDDPEVEFQKRLEHTTFCGYPFEELIVFADACRRYHISEADMHEFCLNTEAAWQYLMDKMHEQMDKEMERILS